MVLKGPAENEKERKLREEREGKQSWLDSGGRAVGVGLMGVGEVEERPVRMSAFQAIVHGKVVQRMHMIVSRWPFTLIMSLTAGVLFFSQLVCLRRGWHCVVLPERDICILLKEIP